MLCTTCDKVAKFTVSCASANTSGVGTDKGLHSRKACLWHGLKTGWRKIHM